MERSLVHQGRKHYFIVEFAQNPGQVNPRQAVQGLVARWSTRLGAVGALVLLGIYQWWAALLLPLALAVQGTIRTRRPGDLLVDAVAAGDLRSVVLERSVAAVTDRDKNPRPRPRFRLWRRCM